jgi:hypothetical protein
LSVTETWGTSLKERKMAYPCDRYLLRNAVCYYRGITIEVSPKIVYLWLCQMNYAPYSYDWLDNFGIKSPNYLIKNAHMLEKRQTFMTVFPLLAYAPNKHITFASPSNPILAHLYGKFLVSYVIYKLNSQKSRLLVKIRWSFPKGVMGKLLRFLAPRLDLIMMRKQLLNIKKYSEQTSISIK